MAPSPAVLLIALSGQPADVPPPRQPEHVLAITDAQFAEGLAADEPGARLKGELEPPTPTARPGLLTLLRELGSGRKLRIDHSNYYHEWDPALTRLNRQMGISFRDPTYWP